MAALPSWPHCRVAYGLTLALSACLGPAATRAAAGVQPNPPQWPDSVWVFDPEDSAAEIEQTVNAAFKENGGDANHGQFSAKRFAFLFKPGTYSVNVPVGYYTQVLGLGQEPDEVVFHPPRGVDAIESRHTVLNEEVNLAENEFRGVYVEEGSKANKFGALSTFWRGAENFRMAVDMLWATAQACPVRRVVVEGTLQLAEYVLGIGMGFSSGGFIANVEVRGPAVFASQQQYLSRNVNFKGQVQGGVWNMVYVGCQGAPDNLCQTTDDQAATVNVQETPVVAEKPFISIDDTGRYTLNVPQAQSNRMGTDWSTGKRFSFDHVFVARDSDSAAAINTMLQQGLHVVLSPGVYHLEEALELNVPNQVILGIGLATLVPTGGNAAVKVGAPGVRLAGVILQAGETSSEALLMWGKDGMNLGDAGNPGFIHDVFARVGGENNPFEVQVQAETMINIFSDHVVGDNLWLWRADHGVSGVIRERDNPCDTGLAVSGNNVTMYGLAVEHTLKDLVLWSGENGRTYFYQSELPYDVDENYGSGNYAGYRVLGEVRNHDAWGVGVYHFFRDNEVIVKSGIDVPPWLENHFHSPLGVWLNGRGRMLHIINDKGGETAQGLTQAQWYCDPSPDVAFAPYTTTATTTTVESTRTTSTRTTTLTVTKTLTKTTTSTTTFTGTSTLTTTVTRTSTTATTTTITKSTTTTRTTTFTGTSSTTTSSTSTITWTGTTTVTTSTTTWSTTTRTTTATTTTTGSPFLLFGAPLEAVVGVQAMLALLSICYCCMRASARRAALAKEAESYGVSPDRAEKRRSLMMDSPPPRGSALSPPRRGSRSRGVISSMLDSVTSPLTRPSFSKGLGARNLSVSSLNMSGMSLPPGPGNTNLSSMSPWGSIAEDGAH